MSGTQFARGFVKDMAMGAARGEINRENVKAHAYDGTVGTGLAVGKTAARTQLKIWENVPRLVVRGLQFVSGLVVVAFYGHRVAASSGPAWVFGLFVAGAACVTAVAFAVMAPFGALSAHLRTHGLYFVDYLLFLLWMIVFGIFAGIFLKRADDDEYQGGKPATQRKVAWLDLANAVLWLVSGTYGVAKVFLGRQVGRMEGKLKDRVLNKDNKGGAGQKMEELYPTQPARVMHPSAHSVYRGDSQIV